MPISSFPISVKSSINLSDINIDTDLNMGANSIIGYAETADLKKAELISLKNYDFDYLEFTKPGETLITNTGYTNYLTMVNTLSASSPFALKPYVCGGAIKRTAAGGTTFYCAISHTINSSTGNLLTGLETASYISATYKTMVTANTGYNATATNTTDLYLNLQPYSGYEYMMKDVITRIGKKLLPLTDFSLSDLNFEILGIVLNGGTFTINGASATYTLGYRDKIIRSSDIMQYTGDVLILTEL